MGEYEKEEKRNKTDIVIYVLSGLLLITMGLAALYGFRYGNVDQSVAVGNISIDKDGSHLMDMTVDKDMNATIHYSYVGREMTGKLVLAGAETDTVLFQLKNIAFADGTDATNVVFFIRMPRSGLQGDYSGVWMTYFSFPAEGLNVSEWILAEEGGQAMVGWKAKFNVITAQRKTLSEKSSAYMWVKVGTSMVLTSVHR